MGCCTTKDVMINGEIDMQCTPQDHRRSDLLDKARNSRVIERETQEHKENKEDNNTIQIETFATEEGANKQVEEIITKSHTKDYINTFISVEEIEYFTTRDFIKAKKSEMDLANKSLGVNITTSCSIQEVNKNEECTKGVYIVREIMSSSKIDDKIQTEVEKQGYSNYECTRHQFKSFTVKKSSQHLRTFSHDIYQSLESKPSKTNQKKATIQINSNDLYKKGKFCSEKKLFETEEIERNKRIRDMMSLFPIKNNTNRFKKKPKPQNARLEKYSQIFQDVDELPVTARKATFDNYSSFYQEGENPNLHGDLSIANDKITTMHSYKNSQLIKDKIHELSQTTKTGKVTKEKSSIRKQTLL